MGYSPGEQPTLVPRAPQHVSLLEFHTPAHRHRIFSERLHVSPCSSNNDLDSCFHASSLDSPKSPYGTVGTRVVLLFGSWLGYLILVSFLQQLARQSSVRTSSA